MRNSARLLRNSANSLRNSAIHPNGARCALVLLLHQLRLLLLHPHRRRKRPQKRVRLLQKMRNALVLGLVQQLNVRLLIIRLQSLETLLGKALLAPRLLALRLLLEVVHGLAKRNAHRAPPLRLRTPYGHRLRHLAHPRPPAALLLAPLLLALLRMEPLRKQRRLRNLLLRTHAVPALPHPENSVLVQLPILIHYSTGTFHHQLVSQIFLKWEKPQPLQLHQRTHFRLIHSLHHFIVCMFQIVRDVSRIVKSNISRKLLQLV